MSCGYASIPLSELVKPGPKKFKIEGGEPDK